MPRSLPLVIAVVALVIVFALGFMFGKRTNSNLGQLRIVDYGLPGPQQQRTALTGTVTAVSADKIMVQEEGVNSAAYNFKRTVSTTVVRLVRLEKKNTKDPLASVFPYQPQPAVFADIKVGDHVYIQADQPLMSDKDLQAVEIKIQSKQ